MTDIDLVDRLRAEFEGRFGWHLVRQAVAEIERLRDRVRGFEKARDEANHLAAQSADE